METETATITVHRCCCCPIEVRGLFAVAHNLLQANGSGNWSKVWQLLGELRIEVDKMQPLVDAHFAAREATEQKIRELERGR